MPTAGVSSKGVAGHPFLAWAPSSAGKEGAKSGGGTTAAVHATAAAPSAARMQGRGAAGGGGSNRRRKAGGGGSSSKRAGAVPGQQSLADSFFGGPARRGGVEPPAAANQVQQVEVMALSDSEEEEEQEEGGGRPLQPKRGWHEASPLPGEAREAPQGVREGGGKKARQTAHGGVEGLGVARTQREALETERHKAEELMAMGFARPQVGGVCV